MSQCTSAHKSQVLIVFHVLSPYWQALTSKAWESLSNFRILSFLKPSVASRILAGRNEVDAWYRVSGSQTNEKRLTISRSTVQTDTGKQENFEETHVRGSPKNHGIIIWAPIILLLQVLRRVVALTIAFVIADEGCQILPQAAHVEAPTSWKASPSFRQKSRYKAANLQISSLLLITNKQVYGAVYENTIGLPGFSCLLVYSCKSSLLLLLNMHPLSELLCHHAGNSSSRDCPGESPVSEKCSASAMSMDLP